MKYLLLLVSIPVWNFEKEQWYRRRANFVSNQLILLLLAVCGSLEKNSDSSYWSIVLLMLSLFSGLFLFYVILFSKSIICCY